MTYATKEETEAVLVKGGEYRQWRIKQDDIITSDQAAKMVGVTRATINTWAKRGYIIGLKGMQRGLRLPIWQFQDALVFETISVVSKRMGTADGWRLLSFYTSPHHALDNRSPLDVITDPESKFSAYGKIMAIAESEAH